MDGRNRHHPLARGLPPHHILLEDPHHPLHRGGGPPRPHPLEDRLIVNHREIQTLLHDNQRLGATHMALKQDVSATQQEFHHVSATASKIKAERDAQVREVHERALKMEDEVRSINGLNSELMQVKEDVKKLSEVKLEMTTELQAITNELSRVRAEVQQAPAVKAEIEGMQKELQRGRAAIEYEKKTKADNLEQSQSMEKNMAVMVREIEKLRAELGNAEKRARAAAAAAAAANPGPGYAGSYGTTEIGYGGNFYADPYSMSQVHGGADGVSQYGSGAVSHGPYGVPQHHLYR